MARRPGLNRDRVVAAAADLIDQAGDPELITLTDVAAHFKVRVPSLYNHVGGLADLRAGVTLLTFQRFHETLHSAAAGKEAEPALVAVAHAARAFARAHPGLYALLLPVAEGAAGEEAARIIALLQSIMQSFDLGERDAIHAIRGLRSILHGFVDIERVGGFGLPVDLDESYRRLIDNYVRGLRNPADDA